MVRQEFLQAVSSTGMMTFKELRSIAQDDDPDNFSEFLLLNYPQFDEEKFAKIMSEKNGIAYLDLKNAKVPTEAISLLKRRQVLKTRMIVIQNKDTKVTVATFDPTALSMANQVSQVLQKNVDVILTNISSWKKLFSMVTEDIGFLVKSIVEVTSGPTQEEEVREEDLNNTDIVGYVNKMLADAFIKKASDIHVEPYEKTFRVRLRIDGNLFIQDTPSLKLMLPLVSRLKIMAQMDISEKRKPQDGRIKLRIGGSPIDYRVSSIPTLFGEKIVMRLLDSSNLQLDMTKLGFEEDQLRIFKEGISQPYGMVLVTGPTGSGKSTTLYSALAELNQADTNISTAEDPVEFNLEGINQVNVKKDIGLTFASALKSFLRQDPDVIMVGEIRDMEVGEIAIEAALTGHLVLSTLHTNDAPSTVTRLLNMGIEPFLVVASLNCIVAQRLCRKICVNCREPDPSVGVEELISVGFSPASAGKVKVFKGKGCEVCNGTGYKGRIAIHEVMTVSPTLREMILKNASGDELKIQAIKEGMKTLRMAALTKVAKGLTTLSEAVSNSSADNR